MGRQNECIASREIGKNAATELRNYIARTPVERIPRNQFGEANWKAIAKELHISESTRTSNPEVRAALEALNHKLGAAPGGRVRNVNDERLQELLREKSRLENQNIALKAENKELRQDRLGEKFFLATGKVLRP